MKIPKSFTIHCHTVTVKVEDLDSAEENRYGYYDSVREEIVVFRKVRVNGEPVELTETQLEATFYHELVHSFQWHIKGTTDEWEAQSYAGLILEFLKTKEE